MQPLNASDNLLPRAVRRQMQGVNDRLAARSAANAAPGTSPTDPAAAPTAPNDSPTAAAGAAPAPTAAPAPSTPPASTADARENSVDYWRDRFSVMQGVNAKQRQDHADALLARDREVADLRQRVQELEQRSTSTPQSDSKLDLSLFFTPEQIQSFGETQCEAMARAAIKAANQQAQQIIEAELKPLKDRAKDADADKAKEAARAFWGRLDELIAQIPEAGNRTIWEINAEQSWLEFLQAEGDDGEVRQALIDRYQRSLNAQGIAKLVKQYLQKESPKPPAPPVAPGGGAASGGDPLPGAAGVNGKGYPSKEEFSDYSKRAATIRNPRDPRYVTSKEREEMEARLRLPRPAGR